MENKYSEKSGEFFRNNPAVFVFEGNLFGVFTSTILLAVI
jgi:hypothetical protein